MGVGDNQSTDQWQKVGSLLCAKRGALPFLGSLCPVIWVGSWLRRRAQYLIRALRRRMVKSLGKIPNEELGRFGGGK